jgi:hypothetical protein
MIFTLADPLDFQNCVMSYVRGILVCFVFLWLQPLPVPSGHLLIFLVYKTHQFLEFFPDSAKR